MWEEDHSDSLLYFPSLPTPDLEEYSGVLSEVRASTEQKTESLAGVRSDEGQTCLSWNKSSASFVMLPLVRLEASDD